MLSKDFESTIPHLHMNIAICCLNLDEIGQGLVSIKKAIETSVEPTDAHSILNRVLAENYYTRLLLEVNNFAGAIEHAKAARHYASRSQSPRAWISLHLLDRKRPLLIPGPLTQIYPHEVTVIEKRNVARPSHAR